jgi:hypothetical protein
MNPFLQNSDPFTNRPDQQTPTTDIHDYLYQQVVAVFLNAQGEQLLNTLEDLYIRQPVCPVDCPEGYGYFREGQNSVIYRIQQMINKARKITG